VVTLQTFIEQIRKEPLARVPGVAIYMVNDPDTTPPSMVHNVKHNKVLHEKVIILSISNKQIPVVSESERMKFEKVDENIFRVVARFGFMESPDIVGIVQSMANHGLKVDLKKITFFLGRETLIASDRPGMALWREHLFTFMARNAQRATAYFNIPADQVIEVGIQVEL
jgi:KUP system potassium uptake protein